MHSDDYMTGSRLVIKPAEVGETVWDQFTGLYVKLEPRCRALGAPYPVVVPDNPYGRLLADVPLMQQDWEWDGTTLQDRYQPWKPGCHWLMPVSKNGLAAGYTISDRHFEGRRLLVRKKPSTVQPDPGIVNLQLTIGLTAREWDRVYADGTITVACHDGSAREVIRRCIAARSKVNRLRWGSTGMDVEVQL